jgi:hypothetical protein
VSCFNVMSSLCSTIHSLHSFRYSEIPVLMSSLGFSSDIIKVLMSMFWSCVEEIVRKFTSSEDVKSTNEIL